MRTFRSDNNSGLIPEAITALQGLDSGHAEGYGDDPWTQRATEAFRELFSSEIEVFFVATGTAANTLAIASLTEPWQRVVCHRHAHWNDDESTAPERITLCRTTVFSSHPSKLIPADLQFIAENGRGDVHQPAPGVVTISNPTEFGTVYRPDEIRALTDLAHSAGYLVHCDGARFANAVASLGVAPNALAGEAGIDVLSFGGTKNGLAFGEAVVFFPQGDGKAARRGASRFPYLRKSTGHLLSKHRVVTAMFEATLRDECWLRHAAHANAMATRLGTGLTNQGLSPVHPVEANGVFVCPPHDLRDWMLARTGFYPFGDAREAMHRLMCSFDTTAEDVDGFVEHVASFSDGAEEK